MWSLPMPGNRKMAIGCSVRPCVFCTITQSSPRGSLEHVADPLKVDLCSFELEGLTGVWKAFNISYRLSVCYQVRIVFIDSTIDRNIVRVTEKVSQFENNS